MFSFPQAVRATPIPVTWMTREEDSLLSGQVGGDRGWWRDWRYDNIRWWKRALRLREDFHFSNWPDCGSKVIRILPVLLVFDQSFFESYHRRVEADICGSHFIPPTSHQVSWSFLLLMQFLSCYTYLQFQRLFHLAVPAWQRTVGSHSCDCYSNHSGPGGCSSHFNSASRTQMFWPNLLAVYLRKVAW